jgi:hypothetical protein
MKTINVIILIAITAVLTFFITKSCNECKEVETSFIITDEQRQNIIQEAREGWISSDSLDKLLADNPVKAEIKYIPVPYDSVVLRDSVNIRDSIVYEPVIEAVAEETADFEYYEENYSAKISVAVKPRYFPKRKVFSTDIGIKSLQVTLKEEESFLNNILSFGIYGGYGYDIAKKEYGFQIGAGFQLRLWDFKLN